MCALPSAWRGAPRPADAFCSTKPRFRACDLPLALALQIVNLLDLHPLDPCKQRAEAGTKATKKGREVASSMKPASREGTSDSPKSSTRSVKRPGKRQNPKVTSGQSIEHCPPARLQPHTRGVGATSQPSVTCEAGGWGQPAAGAPLQLTQITHSSIWGRCAEH